MTQEHPITPPPELIAKWAGSMCGHYEAARWGADQELDACCEYLYRNFAVPSKQLRDHRRPKPPSLKEEALAVLDHTQKGYGLAEVDLDTIRRALEALPD
jgi:hypothetical protein